MPPRYEVIGVEGLPEIAAGDDLAPLIAKACAGAGDSPRRRATCS